MWLNLQNHLPTGRVLRKESVGKHWVQEKGRHNRKKQVWMIICFPKDSVHCVLHLWFGISFLFASFWLSLKKFKMYQLHFSLKDWTFLVSWGLCCKKTCVQVSQLEEILEACVLKVKTCFFLILCWRRTSFRIALGEMNGTMSLCKRKKTFLVSFSVKHFSVSGCFIFCLF